MFLILLSLLIHKQIFVVLFEFFLIFYYNSYKVYLLFLYSILSKSYKLQN